MKFRGSHIISVDQFTLSDVDRVFEVANEMEVYARRKRVTRVLEGAILGNLFFEPSTRSRVSFGAAFNRLGGMVRDTTGFQFSSMAKGESIFDTARVISGYADVLVVRHPVEGAVQEFAEATNVPLINGGDGPGEHPTQALLDLYTIKKELAIQSPSQFTNLKVAMVGDLKYGRTVHSLAKLLCLYQNLELHFVAPDIIRMPETIVDRLRQRGHKVVETTDLSEALSVADIVYVTRIQQERFPDWDAAESVLGSYKINSSLYKKHCKPGVVVMHPLPRDSRPGANELSDDLNGHPKLAIFRQTDNGIPIRMALFALVLGVEDQIHATSREVNWYAPDKIGSFDY